MATAAANDDKRLGRVAPADGSSGVEQEQVQVKVNGVEIEVTEEVVVRDLVVEAKKKGAIAGFVDDYVVERISEDGEILLHETIRVSARDELLAVPATKTPVASSATGQTRTHGTDEQIKNELEGLGYEANIEEGDTSGGRQRVVIFEYRVPTGRFRGKTFLVGVSTQCEAVGYPETPPHWIFVSPPLRETRDGSNHGVNTIGTREWTALSRPPGQFWDRVRNKGMRAYMDHLARVWRRI